MNEERKLINPNQLLWKKSIPFLQGSSESCNIFLQNTPYHFLFVQTELSYVELINLSNILTKKGTNCGAEKILTCCGSLSFPLL